MSLSDFLINTLRPVQFRGKARLLGPLAPDSGERTARVFGSRVRLDLADYIGRLVYLGAYEREETALVSRRLRPGMTFVDVGANIGYFSLLAAHRVGPTGRVIAIEPSPVAYPMLAQNVAANALSVEHHQIGLSDRAGECVLYLPDPARHNHTPTMVAHAEAGSAVAVPVRRLDDCLDDWKIGAVDLLKIDVEGHEPKVFAGAERALASGRIRAVLCEFNDYWLRASDSSPDALHATLRGFGFVDQSGLPHFEPGGVTTRFFVHRPTQPVA